MKSEFSFKKSSTKEEGPQAAEPSGNGTASTSQKSVITREGQRKVRQWIELKSQTLREDDVGEKKCLTLLDLVEAVIAAQNHEDSASDNEIEETKFDHMVQWCDIYEASQSFFKINKTPKVEYIQNLILNGLDLLAKEGKYEDNITEKLRSDLKQFKSLISVTKNQINKNE